MIKFSGNTINKIELDGSSVQKLYCNGNVIYNAITRTTPNRWVISVTSYVCDNNNRYEKQLKQYSLDDGVTWEFYDPEVSRKGNLFETSSSACISSTQSPMYDVTEYISAYSGTFLYVYETYSSQWYQKENNEYVVYHGDYVRMTPEDNVEFSSMAQAQDYEGVWYGQTATISGTDYMFCETNEYMTKKTYQEVSGEYICYQGDKYKKMQQYDRNLDGTTSAHVPPIYKTGELIESGSPDCTITTCSYNFCGVDANGNDVVIDNGTTSLTTNDWQRPYPVEGVVGDATETIGAYCFQILQSTLTALTISENVTTIDHEAFMETSLLTTLTIPSSVTSIDFWAFTRCYGLQEVIFEGTTPPTFSTLYNGVFHDYCPSVIYVPDEAVEAYRAISGSIWTNQAWSSDIIQPINNR